MAWVELGDEPDFTIERARFDAAEADLLPEHEGEYLAVVDDQVFGPDPDAGVVWRAAMAAAGAPVVTPSAEDPTRIMAPVILVRRLGLVEPVLIPTFVTG